MGKIFKISSPDHPKIFLGKAVSDPRHRLSFYNRSPKASVRPILDTKNYTIEILYEGDDYIQKFQEIYHSFDRKLLINKAVAGRCKNEFAREYYHNVIKPNRPEDYSQLLRYHANKEEILRYMALKNVEKYGRRPTHNTIMKYNITEQEIHDALLKGHQALQEGQDLGSVK